MQNKLTMSPNGYKLTTDSESFEDKPYNDPDQNATIGYGHLLHRGPVTVKDWQLYGKGITKDGLGMKFLKTDMALAEHEVNVLVEIQLNQNEFDAMCDFTFNEGAGTLERSTVLKLLNEGDKPGAMAVLLEYDKGDGQVLEGLLTRRKKEIALFETPVPTPSTAVAAPDASATTDQA